MRWIRIYRKYCRSFATTHENISLVEARNKITFDVKLPNFIPFNYDKIYSDVDLVKGKGEQIVVHYGKKDSNDHYLHIIADNIIPAKYNTEPYYSEGDYYQSLRWIDDKINYTIIYFTSSVNEGQEKLSQEELLKIVDSME